jgi:hypothetical protein
MNDRRQVLTGAASTALTFLASRANAEPVCIAPPVIEKTPRPEVVASLSRLLRDRKKGVRPRLKMTRIDGYALRNDDVVFWGRNDDRGFELEFEDLVIAIKSAMSFYEFSDSPLISLDLDPILDKKIFSIPIKAVQHDPSKKRDFARACDEPVNMTRVWGMPFNSRPAKVLVDADYYLKLISTGKANLKINFPFKGSTQLWVENGKRGPEGDQEDRHWFNPGRISYVREGTTTFMDCVQIELKNAIVPFASGNFTVSYYDEFACNFTKRMDDVVRSERVWREMSDQFRHFAIARTLWADESLERSVKARLVEELTLYEESMVEVPRRFPGHMLWVEKRINSNEINVWRVCGGVKMPRSSKKTADASDRMRKEVRLAGDLVLESASSCGEACWSLG